MTKEEKIQEALEEYLREGINYNATPVKMCNKEDLEQLAADSFFEGYRAANKLIKKYKYGNANTLPTLWRNIRFK